MIKVLLADDHKMFIDGLKAVLADDPNVKLIGEAVNGEEVMMILEKEEVDVAILDIRMPLMDGIEATKVIRSKYPNTKVLILTMYNEKDFIMKLMNIGASGYILKNKSSEELLMAIHNVQKGIPHYSLEILNTVTHNKPEKEEDVELTPREREVLCQIAEGLTSKEISDLLHIAIPTVNTHRRNLLQKLDVPNDKFLVRYAIKHGLINL